MKQTGQLEALGDIYDSAPYGYVVPKTDTALADLLVEALKASDADGSYLAALKKYSVEAGAISDFTVNP